MKPSPVALRRLTGPMRRERYVTKVDLLAQDVPGEYRKEMCRELQPWCSSRNVRGQLRRRGAVDPSESRPGTW